MSRIKLDSATGSIDLAWLLVILFFITTVISLRPATTGIKPATPGSGSPVILTLDASGTPSLLDPGGRSLTGPVSSWLTPLCASEPVTVELRCHDGLTHRTCKEGVLGLTTLAPTCSFRY